MPRCPLLAPAAVPLDAFLKTHDELLSLPKAAGSGASVMACDGAALYRSCSGLGALGQHLPVTTNLWSRDRKKLRTRRNTTLGKKCRVKCLKGHIRNAEQF